MVIGTLAIDGWAVTFGTARRGFNWAGCGPAQSPQRCTKCKSPPINGQCTTTNFILFDVALYSSLDSIGLTTSKIKLTSTFSGLSEAWFSFSFVFYDVSYNVSMFVAIATLRETLRKTLRETFTGKRSAPVSTNYQTQRTTAPGSRHYLR